MGGLGLGTRRAGELTKTCVDDLRERRVRGAPPRPPSRASARRMPAGSLILCAAGKTRGAPFDAFSAALRAPKSIVVQGV